MTGLPPVLSVEASSGCGAHGLSPSPRAHRRICRSTEFGPSPPDEELLEQLAGGTWRLQERLLPPFWGLCVALERLVFDVVEDLEPDDFDPRYRIWDSLDRQVGTSRRAYNAMLGRSA